MATTSASASTPSRTPSCRRLELGYSVQGADCYTTLRPCFGCLKELHQAGVASISYLNPWSPGDTTEAAAYQSLLAEMASRGVAVSRLELPERLLDLRAAP